MCGALQFSAYRHRLSVLKLLLLLPAQCRRLTTMAALNWSTKNRSTAPSFSYLARHSAVLSLRPDVDGCSCC